MEVVGSVDEKFDNCAEASSGMLGSGCLVPLLSSFRRFRRRCGSSSELASVATVADDVVADDVVADDVVADELLGVWDVKLRFLPVLAGAKEDRKLPFEIGLTYNRLAEKYDL
jgi:hypothetical protein